MRIVYMTGNFSKNLAKKLKKMQGDMSQTEFAKKIGISQASLNRLQQANQNVTIKTLELLCQRLKISPNDLIL